MISYEKYHLANGLTVILHEDKSSSLVAINMLYKVGSKNEDPQHTGFAHLFEHMMFTGSEAVPDFDIPIQMSGGENNAFTNTDITNFYELVPADNLETALWVEADRMANLLLNQEKLDIQKKVVIEEFYETCLNQPYGDVWHLLSDLSYDKHPYKWPTIGLDPSHIKKITLAESRDFYDNYYQPSNAILVLSGNLNVPQAKGMVDKYFGDIGNRGGDYELRPSAEEDKPGTRKHHKVEVPMKALYISYPMPHRLDDDFYVIDMLSDVLSYGRSSRFYVSLYQKQRLFSSVDAYVSGTIDPGLFVIESKLLENIQYDEAVQAIQDEISKICLQKVGEEELQKVKNKIISNIYFGQVSILNKAINLAYYESIGDLDLINRETKIYEEISVDDIHRCANKLFDASKANYLFYGV